MTIETRNRRRGSYGIDAPYAFAFIGVVILIDIVMATVVAIRSGRVGLLVPIAILLSVAALVLHSTLRGKFLVWSELLDNLKLRGDERVLDLGCGRGAVLLLAAKRLSSGRAVGVDLWRGVDQSGNCEEATRRNAAAEGVADRVELHTADMTALPFEDNSFDLVVSSLAIHNVRGRAGRAKAVDEAARVLRPGGRLMIADIRGTRQHQAQLSRIGMTNVIRTQLGWRLWWGGPWAPTRLVTALKPEHRKGDIPN